MLLALIWFRDDFRAQSDPRVAAAGAGVRARLPGRRVPVHVDHAVRRAQPHRPRPDLLGRVQDRLRRDDRPRQPGPYIYHREGFRDFFDGVADRARDRRRDHPHVPGAAHVRAVPAADRRAPRAGARRSCAPGATTRSTTSPCAATRTTTSPTTAESLVAYVYVARHARWSPATRSGRPRTRRRRSTSSSRSAPARLAGRVLRRARGRRRALPRARHARDLPRRRGDPALPTSSHLEGAEMKAVRCGGAAGSTATTTSS